jgi:hypothetical protein
MRTVTLLQRPAGVISLLVFLGLSACTKESVDPATAACIAPATTACSELVTVRVCKGCPTPVASLQLANGYYVLPIGATWQAYVAQQVDGQVLQVGYELGPALPPNVYGIRTATITCLEVAKASTN